MPPWASSNSFPDNGTLTRVEEKLSKVPSHVLALSAFALGSTMTLAGSAARTRYLRRFRTGDWVTPDVLAKKRWVKGIVTRREFYFTFSYNIILKITLLSQRGRCRQLPPVPHAGLRLEMAIEVPASSLCH